MAHCTLWAEATFSLCERRAKSSLCRQPLPTTVQFFIVYARNSLRDSHSSSGFPPNGASFVVIKKLRKLWSATQDSRNALSRSRAGKKPAFWFIRPDFWTALKGCRQRLLFARQLTQRKCSLCSQGRFIEKLNTPLRSVFHPMYRHLMQPIGLKKLGCSLFFNPLLGVCWILDKTHFHACLLISLAAYSQRKMMTTRCLHCCWWHLK